MKFILVLFFAVLAVASAQRTRYRYLHPVLFPFNPFHRGADEYAASLGGADVGAYRRSQISRGGYGRGYRDTEVSGLIYSESFNYERTGKFEIDHGELLETLDF
ncbi:hypothetical protein TNIN_493491 [Trichonephila inaurata madagascariensis]|uniref:Uncharacterized protein n=1 Tax=Trichonephila inaurata madagascariensis TaxID=2747483 RepID=A0A8X6YIA1_9ARAC|nr:hypothetical protein TNIN_493491 [Trichonephila inaurata madagascariensis]